MFLFPFSVFMLMEESIDNAIEDVWCGYLSVIQAGWRACFDNCRTALWDEA